jgi:hypothetical protein
MSEAVSPLMTAIPLQFLSYFIALALGGNPDVSQDVGDPARFHAAQLLSRRQELTTALSPLELTDSHISAGPEIPRPNGERVPAKPVGEGVSP